MHLSRDDETSSVQCSGEVEEVGWRRLRKSSPKLGGNQESALIGLASKVLKVFIEWFSSVWSSA